MIESAIGSILVLIVVLLPGGLSITVNRLYNPSVSDKSTLMEWSMLMFHATVAHIIGVALMTLFLSLWHSLDTGEFTFQLFGLGGLSDAMLSISWVQLLVYVVVLVIVSVLSGILDFPSWVTYAVAWVTGRGKSDRKPLYDRSIWYEALSVGARSAEKENVQVRVRMLNGDVYMGELQDYPVLPDSENAKDFVISGLVRYYDAAEGDTVDINFGETGGVLLNTGNVTSVEYRYHAGYCE